ncbi:MAG: S8 family peptidase [Peptoniphilus grossensis]|uniref:S8 family peptidase n=1 Tax=Peptoniphilus grossensis TaxID=1465756 RepID=UPI0029151860|nr:S8 family peptidase [Peptoniphilus grossensis]MDU6031325.1 S8 family peptidase [Peptoniphilus harei]MDU7151439.1 S8 family peptidase [Peptoniphilus grossensis]
MDKLLPIKFFEKRKIDEQLTEPGGGKEPPKWVLKDEELTSHSKHLIENTTSISSKFEKYKEENHTLPMVISTEMTEDALAKSHRKQVVDLLNSDKRLNVIGIAPNHEIEPMDEAENNKSEIKETRKILSLVTTDELLDNLNKALQDTVSSSKLISSIANIETFRSACVGYNPENTSYRVTLINYQNENNNRLAQKLFKNQCELNNITINRETRYSEDMNLYRVTLDGIEQMKLLQNFEGVFSIEEAKPITADLDCLNNNYIPTIKAPIDGENYPIVGVLDSGIEKNRYLSPWILPKSETYYESHMLDKSHGSMVASVLEYSDELNSENNTATEGVMMLEAAILPDLSKETVYPEDMLDNVRDAIERHKDIKIWTMSAGTSEESALDTFSEYGMALDNIADENNVLIIKSAGNSVAFVNSQNERIAKMADSVRSLVVGSIAQEKGKYDFADLGMPSPFTRTGPGPSHIIKPDLVAYGGNAGVLPNGNITTTGVKTFDTMGNPSQAPGTSFSTPWIARIAAELNHLLDGDFDPLLIKALMIHNAGYPAGPKMKMADKKKFMGFGMPNGTSDILYNSESEITLVLRDKLQRGMFIDVLDFPFPDCLIGEDGKYHGQITLTMVSSPILRAGEGPEYCQSNINVAFGTMDGIQERDTNKRNIRNPYGAKNAENLMKDSLYSKKVFDVLEGVNFGTERTLLKLGQKFYPIKKYAVDLDEMTDANKRDYLDGSKQWYMKVEGLFREAVEREARDTGEILEQDFCILITIRDPDGKAPIYNEVTQQLQQKGFVYYNVQLKNEIREHVRIEGENQLS